MTRNNSNDESESVDEKRARFERFVMTVCTNGVVNVANQSYGDDAGDHVYSVEVNDGEAVGCSCPHHVHRGAHCKHQVAVENSPIVLSSASAASATREVATDGGREECVECGSSHGEIHEKYGGRCALCGVKALRDDGHPLTRDDEPEPGAEVTGSEAPDFNRGPSGVDDL